MSTGYLLNPEKEREQYADQGDTDKNMLLLQMKSKNSQQLLGVLNWFAVHVGFILFCCFSSPL